MGLVDFRSSKMSSLRASVELQSTPRKKRTFDIAFLTGQSENSSEGTTPSVSLGSKKPISLSTDITRENSSSFYESGDFSPRGDNGTGSISTGTTFALSEATNSSTNSSSIDIMTNGSFVTSDSESPILTVETDQCLRKGKSHKYRQSANNNNRPEIKPTFLEDVKKPIDINQTSSSIVGRSGKDNLGQQQHQQFSGLLPPTTTSSATHHSPSSYPDFRFPHLASTFVFLPQMQMGKFPIHFPGSAEAAVKAVGNDLVNYHAKSRGGFSTEQHYIAAATAAAAYPYHYQNFMLQESQLRNQQMRSSQDPHRNNNQQSSHHQQNQQQQSPPGQITSVSGTVATLLPPSLTALSLPAQNVCAKCNIGFRMTSDLVYHMRSHHKRETDPLKKKREDKLKCPVCHETFRERHHLTRHMTAHQDRAEEIELDGNKVALIN